MTAGRRCGSLCARLGQVGLWMPWLRSGSNMYRISPWTWPTSCSVRLASGMAWRGRCYWTSVRSPCRSVSGLTRRWRLHSDTYRCRRGGAYSEQT
ncbi:hypothetical protein AOLI_G00055870 [Acnodon oligacanthus]